MHCFIVSVSLSAMCFNLFASLRYRFWSLIKDKKIQSILHSYFIFININLTSLRKDYLIWNLKVVLEDVIQQLNSVCNSDLGITVLTLHFSDAIRVNTKKTWVSFLMYYSLFSSSCYRQCSNLFHVLNTTEKLNNCNKSKKTSWP